MAVALTISTKELERQAKLVFEGQAYKLFLANNASGLTADSTAAAWEAVEVTGGGYVAATGTIAAGTYNGANARYEMPKITATFTASTGGFTYNTICLKIAGSTHLHSVTTESPAVVMASGQSKSYTITLAQDD